MFSRTEIIGYMGRSDGLKFTPSGKAVLNFSVGVSGFSKNDETEWYRVAVWDEAAEKLQDLVPKAKIIRVEGRLKPRAYEDKNGKTQISMDISAFGSGIRILSYKPQEEGDEQPQARAVGRAAPAAEEAADEDLPF